MEMKTKKKYVAPKMTVIETSPTSILAGSGPEPQALDVSNDDYTPTGDEGYWGD